MTNTQPHAVTLDGRLYGYGETRNDAVTDFINIASVNGIALGYAIANCRVVPLDDDEASEVAEMLAADAVRWEAVG